MIDVCSSATSDMLVSLADCKEAMNITDAGSDASMTRFIQRASARIESYCDRPLLDQVYQAAIPSYGGPRLQLPRYPVRAVLRVFDGTDTGSAIELSATDYKVDHARGQLYREAGFQWTAVTYPEVSPFPENRSELDRWLVEFSAGYVPPQGKDSTHDGTTSTGRTLPSDIEEAAITLVRGMWLSRSNDPNIRSKSVGEISVTYAGGGAPGTTSMPQEVADLLAPYRSLV